MDNELITKLDLEIQNYALKQMAKEKNFQEGMEVILTSIAFVMATAIASLGKTTDLDREAYLVFVDRIVKIVRNKAIKFYSPNKP